MKYIYIFILLILISAIVIAAKSNNKHEKVTLKIGDMAPDFKLKDDTGKVRTLSDFEDQYLVVYFYPKNDTPGCTKQACSFRDDYSSFKEKNINVVGISFDSAESHKKFKEKYNLPFILLSDTSREVAAAYGATSGMKSLFPKRITFMIDPQGKIFHIFDNVSVTEHAQNVLEKIKAHKDSLKLKNETRK